MVSSEDQGMDEVILQVFEEHEESFHFPVATQKEARAFVKALHGKGFSYDCLLQEIKELEQNFSAWRKGISRPGIGNRVIERINRPLQEILLSDGEEEDPDCLDQLSTDSDEVESNHSGLELRKNGGNRLAAGSKSNLQQTGNGTDSQKHDKGDNCTGNTSVACAKKDDCKSLGNSSVEVYDKAIDVTKDLKTEAGKDKVKDSDIQKDVPQGQIRQGSSVAENETSVGTSGKSVEIIDKKKEAVAVNKQAVTEKKEEAVAEKKQEAVTEKKQEAVTEKKQEAVTEKKLEAVVEKKQEAVTENKQKEILEKKQETVTEKKQETVTEKKQDAVADKKLEAVAEKKQEAVTEKKTDAVTGNKQEAVTEKKLEAVTEKKQAVTEKKQAVTENKQEAVTEKKQEAVSEKKQEAVTEKKQEAVLTNNQKTTQPVNCKNKEVDLKSGIAAVKEEVRDQRVNKEKSVESFESEKCESECPEKEIAGIAAQCKSQPPSELVKLGEATLKEAHSTSNPSEKKLEDEEVSVTESLVSFSQHSETDSKVLEHRSLNVHAEPQNQTHLSGKENTSASMLVSSSGTDAESQKLKLDHLQGHQSTSGGRCQGKLNDIRESYDSDFDDEFNHDAKCGVTSTGDAPSTTCLQQRVTNESQVDDRAGYVYLFTDSSAEPVAFRVKVGATRFPHKKLQQSLLFNVDMKLVSAVQVSDRRKALDAVHEKLNAFSIPKTVGWFCGPLESILTVLMAVAKDYPHQD